MKFDDVTLGYPGNDVLTNINFVVQPGEFIFLIGRSGAGKSTIIKALIGGLKPTNGFVYNDEHQDIYTFTGKEMEKHRRSIGVIFQDYKLLKTKTIGENVAFAMEVCGYGDDTIAERVPEVLIQVGLYEKKDNFVHELSGGELQRAAIARALVHNPDMILADEPTGNLDPMNAAIVIELLQELNNQGKTVIFATHDKELVNDMKKRVIAFGDGKILSDRKRAGYIDE